MKTRELEVGDKVTLEIKEINLGHGQEVIVGTSTDGKEYHMYEYDTQETEHRLTIEELPGKVISKEDVRDVVGAVTHTIVTVETPEGTQKYKGSREDYYVLNYGCKEVTLSKTSIGKALDALELIVDCLENDKKLSHCLSEYLQKALEETVTITRKNIEKNMNIEDSEISQKAAHTLAFNLGIMSKHKRPTLIKENLISHIRENIVSALYHLAEATPEYKKHISELPEDEETWSDKEVDYNSEFFDRLLKKVALDNLDRTTRTSLKEAAKHFDISLRWTKKIWSSRGDYF